MSVRSPRGDGGAMSGLLRSHAVSYEPDGDRIRTRMDGATGMEGVAGGPVREGSPDLTDAVVPLLGRPARWRRGPAGPAAAAVAAGLLILAGNLLAPSLPAGPSPDRAPLAALGDQESPTTGVSATSAPAAPSVAPSSATSAATTSSAATTAAGTASSSSASSTPAGTSVQASPSAATRPTAPGAALSPTPSRPAVVQSPKVLLVPPGGALAEVSVRPVDPGSAFNLSAGARDWIALTTATQVTGGGRAMLGPAQVLGSDVASVEAGPFALRWSGGVPQASALDARQWTTAPASSRGTPGGIRLPVRWQESPRWVTVLVGTQGGGGRMVISGAGGEPFEVALTDCGRPVCPAEVTLTLVPTAASGQLTVDLYAAGRTTRIGVAAATLR